MEILEALYYLVGWLKFLERPVKAEVVVPKTYDLKTGKELTVPQSVMNDVITAFNVVFKNLSGQPVSPPPGGTTTVALNDASGNPSTLGTAQLGKPDPNNPGSYTPQDGSCFSVIPNLPSGSAMGDAVVQFDDHSDSAGGPNDISFTFAISFTNDPTAESASVDTSNPPETFPLPGAQPGPSASVSPSSAGPG